MGVRYNGLDVVAGNPADTTVGQLGDLTTLLQWNTQDPADDFEMNRNNYIYTWQVNRNPFIDYPLLANYIWGANAGQVWNASLSNGSIETVTLEIYPNPAADYFVISGISGEGNLALLNVSGQVILQQTVISQQPINVTVPAGIYFAKITIDGRVVVKKLIVK